MVVERGALPLKGNINYGCYSNNDNSEVATITYATARSQIKSVKTGFL
jgi:hypothetical protein